MIVSQHETHNRPRLEATQGSERSADLRVADSESLPWEARNLEADKVHFAQVIA